MNVQFNGEYEILVHSGGSLYIYDSKIASSDQIHRFGFLVEGSNFVMIGSRLQDAGWCEILGYSAPVCDRFQSNRYNGDQGLQVETDQATVKGNSISNCGIGLILAGDHDVAQSNNITSSDYSSLVIAQSSLKGIGTLYSNDTVEGNTFHQNVLLDSAMIFIEGRGGNVIQNNTFGYTQTVGQVTLYAIEGDSGWGNLIRNNNVTSTGGFFMLGDSNDVISGNTVTFCEAGVWLANEGGGTMIEGNHLQSGLVVQSKGHYCGGQGIQVRGARGLTIASNTITGLLDPQDYNVTINSFSALDLVQTYNSFVVNNNATWDSYKQPSFYLLDSDQNTIVGNRLVDSGRNSSWAGIFMDASNNNTLFDNQLTTPAPYNIALDKSSGNLLYDNNFFGKPGQGYDSGKNSWSKGTAGNYWEASGASGPHRIPPNGTDLYPLSAPATIAPAQLPPYSPVPIPQKFSGQYVNIQIANSTVMKGATTAYQAGDIDVATGGNLTIVNSNLMLGAGDSFNLQIENGGSLTIKNSNFTWVSGVVKIMSGGEMAIDGSRIFVTGTTITALSINLDGSLTIEKSVLQAAEGSGGFSICTVATNGASLTVLDSVLNGGSNCGDYYTMIKMDPQSDYCKLIIENSILENAPAGITIGGQHDLEMIVNDTFSDMSYPIETAGVETAIVTGNLVYSSTNGMLVSASNITVQNNTLLRGWSGGIGVQCSTAGFVFAPLTCVKASDTIGNIVKDTLGVGLVVQANDTTVADNTVTNSDSGIVVFGNDNSVYGNTVVSLDFKGQGNVAFHNNILGNSTPTAGNSWSYNGEGNYWAGYSGKDPDLDGIGDTPYSPNGAQDGYPFMQPNGWLTKLYLTVQTNIASQSPFQINGTTFSTGNNGKGVFRLGYVTSYVVSFPQILTLPNGTGLGFVKWSDGFTSPTRTIALASNSTIQVVYEISPATSTISSSTASSTSSTTTASSTISTTSSSSTTSPTSTSTLTQSSLNSAKSNSTTTSSTNNAAGGGGGIPEFPLQLLPISVLSLLIVVSYLAVRFRSRTSARIARFAENVSEFRGQLDLIRGRTTA